MTATGYPIFTLVTFERLFPSVLPHMHSQMTCLRRWVFTLVTPEGFLSSVCPQMLLHLRSFVIWIVALAAFLCLCFILFSEIQPWFIFFRRRHVFQRISFQPRVLFHCLLLDFASTLWICWCLTKEICPVIFRISESDEDNSEMQSPGLTKNESYREGFKSLQSESLQSWSLRTV